MTASSRTVLAAGLTLALAAATAALAQASAVHHHAPGDPWPRLAAGDVVRLAPGRYAGPWEIDVPGVRIEAEGAELVGPAEGSALILTAPGIEVRDLRVRDAGRVADLYAPDAAAWLLGCDRCRIERLTSDNTPAGLRIEESRDVTVVDARLRGAPDGPGLTAYLADGLTLQRPSVNGFLDGIYIERSDAVRIVGAEVAGARRYGLHLMFGQDLELVDSVVRNGGVGSAVMYGRDALLAGNRFEGHVGPLAYGLLIQEMAGTVVRDTTLAGNTLGALIVSAPDVRLSDNDVLDSGTGLLVRRTPDAAASTVRATNNRFIGNVADVAVDDPEASVALRGNAYDAASRLDRDGDGVSDAPYLPTSSFALLTSRTPDLSLFAASPGVALWEAAEARVPGLRMASLHDPTPRPLARRAAALDGRSVIAATALIAAALAFALTLAGGRLEPRRRNGGA